MKTTPDLRARILVLLAIVAAICYMPGLISFQVGGWDIKVAMLITACGFMIALPFIAAKKWPALASFDRTWFPAGRYRVASVILFVCVVVGAQVAVGYLLTLVGPDVEIHKTQHFPSPTSIATSWQLLVFCLLATLAIPIAEELFWRGYVLDQLEKTTSPFWALLIHVGLFTFVHDIWSSAIRAAQILCFALIVGWWRQRMRSLLPLIIAHAVVNAIAFLPTYMPQYNFARKVEAIPAALEIRALAQKPSHIALPKILRYLDSEDETVQTFAALVVCRRYRDSCGPYLVKMLSQDGAEVQKHVFAMISFGRITEMQSVLRQLANDSSSLKTQGRAVATLADLGDIRGLKQIAEHHQKDAIQNLARRLLESSR